MNQRLQRTENDAVLGPRPAPTGVAVFRDVKADIVRRIVKGEWAPGALLPAEPELCRDYGVARSTLSRAMRELVEDGLIERRRKAGTRVRLAPLRKAQFDIPVVGDEITASGGVYRYALVRSEIGPAPDWLRARMALRPGAEARHLLCLVRNFVTQRINALIVAEYDAECAANPGADFAQMAR